LEYNVFVLDATIDDLRKEVPYLMMRMCGPGVPGGGADVDSTEDSKIKVVTKAKADAKAHSGLTKAKTEPSISKSTSTSTSIPTSTSMSAKDVLSHMQRDALFDIGAHTDGPDGHLVEEGIVEKEREKEERATKREVNGVNSNVVDDMSMDVDMDESGLAVDTGAKDREEDDDILLPNTVDFAFREKEEMRDLTKASEIISLYPEPSMTSTPSSPASSTKPGSMHTSIPISLSTAHSSSLAPKPETLETKSVWEPLVGQVYLGNSGDVPLAPDVPSHFRHASSLVRDTTLHGNPCAGLAEYFSTYDDEDDANLNEEIGSSQPLPADDLFNYHATNDPNHGFGYDIAVECHELAPFPSTAHLRASDEHLGTLDLLWKERWERAWRAREEKRVKKRRAAAGAGGGIEEEYDSMTWMNPPPAPSRPPPHASAVIHLPFPSSPSNNQTTMVSLMPVIRFLEKWMKPLPVPLALPEVPEPVVASASGTVTPEMKNLKLVNGDAVLQVPPAVATPTPTSSARRWSSVAALMPSFASFPLGGSSPSASTPTAASSSSNSETNAANLPTSTTTVSTPPFPPHPARNRSFTSPHPSGEGVYQGSRYMLKPPPPQPTRTRPLKILLYSSDGYTESSVPALCLLMAIKSLNLPEAYLELQVVKRRSFFVYQADLGILRRVEARLKEEKERERERERGRERERERLNGGFMMGGTGMGCVGSVNANGKRTASVRGGYWSGTSSSSTGLGGSGTSYPGGTVAVTPSSPPPVGGGGTTRPQKSSFTGRPAAKSVSFAQAPHLMAVPSLQQQQQQHEQQHEQYQQNQSTVSTVIPSQPYPIPGTSYLGQTAFSGGFPMQSNGAHTHIPLQLSFKQSSASYSGGSGFQEGHQVVKGRPRANTSPWLPSLFGGDHQSWFNDPRFDGSFPSRVLPFLYLGNLCVLFFWCSFFVFLKSSFAISFDLYFRNHASNAYMLHALGITHVVSVGECALVPPPHHIPGGVGGSMNHRPSPNAHYIAGKGPGGHGSLWIEEREGRIKVLDIKGVCDDGIDTLEPQLEPICDWIDKARQEGGQVLVHCRVGVSRSATVTVSFFILGFFFGSSA
jgi:dual specificity MAP kinase phosphatase